MLKNWHVVYVTLMKGFNFTAPHAPRPVVNEVRQEVKTSSMILSRSHELMQASATHPWPDCTTMYSQCIQHNVFKFGCLNGSAGCVIYAWCFQFMVEVGCLFISGPTSENLHPYENRYSNWWPQKSENKSLSESHTKSNLMSEIHIFMLPLLLFTLLCWKVQGRPSCR